MKEGEHIFALGRALLGNDMVRVNQFRKEILALNPSLGANDERIEPGMKLKLSEYLKTSVGANATPGAAPKATAPAAAQVPLTSNAIGSEPTRKPVVASVAVTVPAPAAPAPRAAALKEASQPTSANTAVAQVSPTATAPPHEGAARPAPATIVPNVAPLVVNPATGGLRVFTFDVIINGAKSGTWIFVERVMTNFWIYRIKHEQDTESLDNVAEGDWPVYTAQDVRPPATLLAAAERFFAP